MKREEITAVFDRQASTYDQQWRKMSPANSALHLLTNAVLAKLPQTANILSIGAGTGAEIIHLAQRFPRWRFTAVEPSVPMLDVLRRKAEENGILSRCVLHAGYLDSLPPGDNFDAATAFLVSQFIQDRELRKVFFQSIANRLRPDGILVSSALAGDLDTVDCQNLLEVWFKVMSDSGISDEGIEKMREAYTRDVAVLPPHDVRDIIVQGGFESPILFFQAGMIHAWYAKRSLTTAGPGA
jgi:tRNA (cmo5U34)-methyltransferase